MFRRSFSTWLDARSVSGDHIDRLLGHAPQSVRGKHYSAPDLPALRKAVETIVLDLGDPTGHESGPEPGSLNRPKKDLAQQRLANIKNKTKYLPP